MKSGLEDRNNPKRFRIHIHHGTEVSMKSGLEDRNNADNSARCEVVLYHQSQ